MIPRVTALVLSILFSGLLALGSERALGGATAGRGGCDPDEKWLISSNVQDEWSEDDVADFQEFIAGKINPTQAMADGLALRGKSTSSEGRMLAEYWMARSLWKAGFPHLAHQGFAALAAKPVKPAKASIQNAALSCLIRLHIETPALGIPADVIARLSEYPPSATVADAATFELRSVLAEENVSKAKVDGLLKLVAGFPKPDALARALWEQRQGHFRVAIAHFQKYFAPGQESRDLDRKVESHLRVQFARTLFSSGQYDAAIEQYKWVGRESNELANSLSELAWAYLQAGRYTEAIGTAISLQAGGLRHTFTPEAYMVMAMALNEICQYQESVRAINTFRKNYDKSYRWLAANQNAEAGAFYKEALAYVRKTGTIPRIVASEWVRSPAFIANHGELNLLLDEAQTGAKLPGAAEAVQKLQLETLVTFLDKFKPRFDFAVKERKNEDDDLPAPIVNDLRKLKRDLVHYYRLRRSAPVWRQMISHNGVLAKGIKAHDAGLIHSDLKAKTERMSVQLEEIAENLQLVEVEIYNGASQDILWQNAHPEYKDLAKSLSDDNTRKARERVWDWGRFTAATEADGTEKTEIWEDELGSFKANLVDNCSSKDKFIALRLQQGRKPSAAGASD